MQDFFHWIGEQLGTALRFAVDALAWLFNNFYGAIDSFIQGLTEALGIDASIFSLLILVLGIAMLAAAVQSGMRRRAVGAVVWALLGVVVLSWLIH